MAVWGVGFILGPDPGPDGRRLPGRRVVVALDLLHQPAGRHRRLPHGAAPSCSTRRTCASRADRLVGAGADGRGLRLPAARARPGRARGLVRLDRRSSRWPSSPSCALVAFLIRELTASDPILDLTVFTDRNFATGASLIAIVGFGMFSGMLLVAVFTQKLLGYDAWTSGLVLAPGRARQHLLAVRLRARDPRRPAADAGLRLPAQRRQPLHDDLPHPRHGLLGAGAARASSRASRSGSSSCRSPR